MPFKQLKVRRQPFLIPAFAIVGTAFGATLLQGLFTSGLNPIFASLFKGLMVELAVLGFCWLFPADSI